MHRWEPDTRSPVHHIQARKDGGADFFEVEHAAVAQPADRPSTVPARDVLGQAGQVAEPGETVTAGITVDTPGTYEFLCTVPGHADAGMRDTVTVG